jgi:hypothetical protein
MRSPGWREPISISGQGKAAWASYSAGGLVFCGWFPERADISQAGDLRFTGIASLNAPPNQPEEIHS